MEKDMATHCSTPARRIPWTEESGGLQSMGLQRVGHKQLSNSDFHFPTMIKGKILFAL